MKKYKTWWLVLWAVVAAGLIVGTVFLPFWQWAVAAVGSFGVMEALGIWNESGSGDYPPLTRVIVGYVPAQLAYAAIYALFAGAIASWLRGPAAWLAAAGALGGWLVEHFREAYASKTD